MTERDIAKCMRVVSDIVKEESVLQSVLNSLDVALKDRNSWRDKAHHLAMTVLQSDLYKESRNARTIVDDILYFYGGKV